MLGVERHKLDLNVIVRAYSRTLSLKKSCLFGGVNLIFRKLRSYFNKDYVCDQHGICFILLLCFVQNFFMPWRSDYLIMTIYM